MIEKCIFDGSAEGLAKALLNVGEENVISIVYEDVHWVVWYRTPVEYEWGASGGDESDDYLESDIKEWIDKGWEVMNVLQTQSNCYKIVARRKK